MRVYIAASFVRRNIIRPYRDKLWAMGHEVTSTWLDEVAKPHDMTHAQFFKKLAVKDLCEIAAADLLILETSDIISEGKNTEFGFALGQFQKKLTYIVGDLRTPFHFLADGVFQTWDDLLDYIDKHHNFEHKFAITTTFTKINEDIIDIPEEQ